MQEQAANHMHEQEISLTYRSNYGKKLIERDQPDARLKVVTLPEVFFPLVRGEQGNLGGELRLKPSRRQVVLANRALVYQKKETQLMATTLDENKGKAEVLVVKHRNGATGTVELQFQGSMLRFSNREPSMSEPIAGL